MGKFPEISKLTKSNAVLLKEKGYKNREVATRFGLFKASVSRILHRYKEKAHVFYPNKEVGILARTIIRTNRVIKQICRDKPSIISTEIRTSPPERSDVSI